MNPEPPSDDEAMPNDPILSAAIAFYERGYAPIRVRPSDKAPMDAGWQTPCESMEQLLALRWTRANVGLLVGVGKRPLAVLDFDHERARALAPHFHELSGMTTTRDSVEGVSHLLVEVSGELRSNVSVSLPGHGALVELHAQSRQVVCGPSIHPSGDTYRTEGTAAVVDGAELVYAFRCHTTATVLSLAWPVEGDRQKAAAAAAGTLYRLGVDEQSIVTIVTAAAREAGDTEWQKRADMARDTCQKAQRRQPTTGAPQLRKLLGAEPVECIGAIWPADSGGDGSDDDDGGLHLEVVLEIAESADLFTTDMGELHATVAFNGQTQIVKVASKGKFRLWLQNSCFEQFRKVPTPGMLDTVIALVTARAESRVEQRIIRTRVAPYEAGLVLDLADDEGQFVVVTPGGWHVTTKSPAALRRTKGQLALPVPVGGGNLEELLGSVLHVGSRDNLRLCVAWLLAALSPNGPFPIILFTGEEGTGKTVTTRKLRGLIDPMTVGDRQTIRDTLELAIISQSNRVIALDNLDGVPKWLSNAICGLSTGFGFTIRTLYTNDEETQFTGSNPVIINGIGDIATRGDLLSRILMLALAPIPKERRRSLRELNAAFEAAHPRILGAALDVIAASLDRIGNVETPELPRLADFAELILAMEPALGWPHGHIIDLLNSNAAIKTSAQVDASVVAEAVIAFARRMPEATHSEGASSFLKTLTTATSPDVTIRREWPKAANHLTRELGRIGRTLRESHHIDVDVRRTRNGSVVTIRRHGDDAERVRPDDHRHAKALVVMPDGDGVTMVTVDDAEPPVAHTSKDMEALRAPESPRPSGGSQPRSAEPSSPIVTPSLDCLMCDMDDDTDTEGLHCDGSTCPRFTPPDSEVA